MSIARKSHLTVVMPAIAAAFVSLADTYVWTGANNDSDWTAGGGNFASGAPGSGDIVEIPAGMTAYVKDAASASVVASLAQVKLLAEDGKDDGKIVFDMGDSDLTINCALGAMADQTLTGSVVKKGAGTLVLSNQTAFAYMAKMSIEAGTVRLPTDTSGYRYGSFDIASGAALVTSPNGQTLLYGLTGSGLVTNEVASNYRNLNLNGTTSGSGETGSHDFSGRIAGLYYYESSGRVMLRGTDNAFCDSDFTVYNTSTSVRDLEELAARSVGVTGVMKFGLKGENSTVGVSNDIRTLNYGGGLLYLGSGSDTTDRSLTALRPDMGITFIDGGANGGLRWNGDIVISGNSTHNGMGVFGLLGSNETACVIGGTFNSADVRGTNVCFFVEKAGSGVWRFADAADNRTQRTFWSSMAVKNGTLQFDSMAEAGQPCALGLATNLTASYYGPRDDAGHPGAYAYWLGSAGKTATFEFTGTNSVLVTTRPIALEGDARLKNSTAYPWRFSGVTPTTSGAKNLYLSGSGAAENEIAGIADSPESPVSIVKEGVGTWILNGSNTISGSVSVNAGTLCIRRDCPYSWFRWTLRNKSVSGASLLYLTEFALYDENGKRINIGLSYTNNWNGIAAGQIALPKAGNYKIGDVADGTSNRSLTALVDGYTAPCNIARYIDGTTTYEAPVEGTPSTHLPVLMRMPPSASAAKYYDVCIHYPSTTTDKNRKTNPNSWLLEASPDGIHWDPLHDVTGHEDASLAYTWANAGVQYKSTTATEAGTGGYGISGYPDYRPSSSFTNAVSVASGATLKAIGEVVLSSIRIDAANAGTIDGFSLAETGEIAITNLPADGTVDGVFMNAANLQNLKTWALSVNGKAAASKKVVVCQDGTLKIVARGLMFSIR